MQTLQGARAALQVHARHAVEGPAGEGAATRSCTAPATTRSSSPTTTACAPTTSRSRSRACIAQPRAPLQGDRQRLGARGARHATSRATPCEACHGSRLKPEALAVKIDGAAHRRGHANCRSDARGDWFDDLPSTLDAAAAARSRARILQGNPRPAALPDRCRPRLPDPGARLRHAVGRREPAHPARLADRLGPDRRALRARRALDRPAPARQRRGCSTRCKRLRDLGNTVLVVEHDEDAIRAADYVHRHGPGAGVHGGQIVAAGHARRDHAPTRSRSPANISPAARDRRCRDAPQRRPPNASLHDQSAPRGNNLKNVTAEIPLGTVHLRHRRLRRRQVDAASSTRSTRPPRAS